MRGIAISWIVVCAAACGGSSGGDDDPAFGTVAIVTLPNTRVDFMSAAGEVIGGGVVDGSGRISAEIERGDRAVVVTPVSGEIVVLDALVPEREYYWLERSSLPRPALDVVVDWPAVTGATFFQIQTGCGGASPATSPQLVRACRDNDGIFVVARDDTRVPLGIAYQAVTPTAVNQPFSITAPFAPPRSIEMSVVAPATHVVVDSSVRVVLPDRSTFEVEQQLDVGVNTRPIPDVTGDLRTFVLLGDDPRLVVVHDRRPLAGNTTLDLSAQPLPRIDGEGTYDAATRTAAYPITGDATADAIVTFLGDTPRYRVIQPYSPAPILPTLPPDLAPPTSGAAQALVMSSADYTTAIATYGRLGDPELTEYALVASGIFAISSVR